MKVPPGALFALALACLCFAQGIPLARRPDATLEWLRGLPLVARFLLRANPYSYGVKEARSSGIGYIVFGCLCIVVAVAAEVGLLK